MGAFSIVLVLHAWLTFNRNLFVLSGFATTRSQRLKRDRVPATQQRNPVLASLIMRMAFLSTSKAVSFLHFVPM